MRIELCRKQTKKIRISTLAYEQRKNFEKMETVTSDTSIVRPMPKNFTAEAYFKKKV